MYVEGRLQTRKWQDKDGNDKYTTEIVADRMQMLGGRSGGGNSFEVMDSGSSSGRSERGAGGGGAKPVKSGGDFDDFEDDIPF